MTGLAIVGLILMGIWVGVLTLAMLLVIRQLGVLTLQLSRGAPGFSIDTDGLEIGSSIPVGVVDRLPQIDSGRAAIMLVSATCMPCHTLVEELPNYRLDPPIITLLAGRPEPADALAQLLASSVEVIIRDPEATEIAEALKIHSTPFGLVVEERRVTSKAYLRSAKHFLTLLNNHVSATTDAF